MAFNCSPVIEKLSAQIEALRGKQVQAGLGPNPTFGVMGEDMFDNGNAGRFGVYVSQQFIRGGKLCLSQKVVEAEIATAERQLELAGRKLLTDVRKRYYDALLAQQQVELTETLRRRLEQIVKVSQALVEAKEVARTSPLQSEIELEKTLAQQRQAENNRVAAFGQLATLINSEELPWQRLTGDVANVPSLESIETAYDRLLSDSPEIEVLLAEIETAKRTLSRAIVQPIPNLNWQSGLAYDTASDHIVAGFQVGMPIPVCNKNQGAIYQAQQQIVAAERALEQKVLQLRQRLVAEYQKYHQARIQVEAYENQIIPKSQETLELIAAGYQEGEVGFLDVLTAQRTYVQVQLDYLVQLRQLRRQAVLIEGQLLENAL